MNFYQKKAREKYDYWTYSPYSLMLEQEAPKMSKVVVSAAVAEKLDMVFKLVESNHITKYEMIAACAKKMWGDECDILNSMKPDTMLEILINGYEAECMTPEQKQEAALKSLHDSFALSCNTVDEFYAYRTGMRDVLTSLGYDYNWIKFAKDAKSHTLKITLDKPSKL